MKVLFAGGGTAGHINPALAVAGFMREVDPSVEIFYIGTQRGLESRLVPAAGYDFRTIDVAGFQRRISLKNIKRNIGAAVKVLTSSYDARKILKEIKPDVVVGTGGYVSGPVLREAAKLGIKTAIHEQNAFPGVTTKMLSREVDTVMLAMPEAEAHLKLQKKPVLTGNPVRRELILSSREEARKKLDMDDRPFILSFGGSLGARAVNMAVAELMAAHRDGDYYLYHATGKSGKDMMASRLKELGVWPDGKTLRVTEYINDMDILLAAADLVICRAGAITISELEACGRPAILIPSPYVAENHQFHNAMALQKRGAAKIIEEKDLNGTILIKTVDELLSDPDRLTIMGEQARSLAISDANERIYNCITDLYNSRTK